MAKAQQTGRGTGSYRAASTGQQEDPALSRMQQLGMLQVWRRDGFSLDIEVVMTPVGVSFPFPPMPTLCTGGDLQAEH